MGFIDNFAKKVAEQINKAPILPAGTVTVSESDMVARAGISTQQYGQSDALPRNIVWGNTPFPSGIPITPGAINPVREDGRPDPRRYEFQTAQNINITPTKVVPFTTLRQTADLVDIIRRCLEVNKAKMAGYKWDIVISEDASERISSESGKDHIRAMADAREKYTEDIARLRAFWEMPDRANGLVWSDWLNLFLEDNMVLDAVAIWPQKSVGGELYGLQILDGATIKPLIDDRGMRPMPPYPAYQQILWGFPRSEFMATNDNEEADGEFTSDELIYLVKNRRTWTVYGFSPVERSLPLADIYLRRQDWIRKEYTDGVTPELMIKTDATFGGDANLLRAYENVFNDDLAGQTAQRKRVRILAQGMEPIQYDGYGEKFKDTLDKYIVTSICGHFGVLPSEIGMVGSGSLGASGLQQGETLTAESVSIKPLAEWISNQISNISYTYLGMPRELEFKIMFESNVTTEEDARRMDIEMKGGTRTVNEARAERGLPLLDAPEADMPMLFTSSGLYFISGDGLVNAQDSAISSDLIGPDGEEIAATTTIGNTSETETGKPDKQITEVKENIEDKAEKEVKAFLKWTRKGVFNRKFNFEHVEPEFGDMLNKYIEVGDLDSARWYAERFIGL